MIIQGGVYLREPAIFSMGLHHADAISTSRGKPLPVVYSVKNSVISVANDIASALEFP